MYADDPQRTQQTLRAAAHNLARRLQDEPGILSVTVVEPAGGTSHEDACCTRRLALHAAGGVGFEATLRCRNFGGNVFKLSVEFPDGDQEHTVTIGATDGRDVVPDAAARALAAPLTDALQRRVGEWYLRQLRETRRPRRHRRLASLQR